MKLLTDHLRLGPIRFRGRVYSPAFVGAQIDRVATHLDKTVTSSSRIVVLPAANHIKSVVLYFGIIKSGRVALLTDTEWSALEWAEVMRTTPPCAVARIDEATDEVDPEEELTTLNKELDRGDASALDDVCTMLHSAAHDGHARAVMLTHDNMVANAHAHLESDRSLQVGSCCCALVPYHHLFGLQTGVLVPALAGVASCIVSLSELGHARGLVAELLKARVDHLYTVPAILRVLATAWQRGERGGVPDILVTGGHKMSSDLARTCERELDRPVHEGYGLTEAAPICTWNRPGESVRADSVGRAFPCCEVRIADESGHHLAPGQVGEVCVRGSNVMKGYFRDDQLTRDTVRGGWLRTGDLGRLDNDGYLYLTGMKKRMLNVCGRKIWPAEVERLMRMNANVEEAHIYGKPHVTQSDSVLGRVRLRVKGEDAEREFTSWCTKRISGYKIPRRIEFV